MEVLAIQESNLKVAGLRETMASIQYFLLVQEDWISPKR
jgi:hypothetical protein